MSKKLIENANLTGLCNFLNKNYKKQGGGKFSPRDVHGYIKRGQLPVYLGNKKIVEVNQDNCSVKLYNLIEE